MSCTEFFQSEDHLLAYVLRANYRITEKKIVLTCEILQKKESETIQ